MKSSSESDMAAAAAAAAAAAGADEEKADQDGAEAVSDHSDGLSLVCRGY